ncbi:MAG TPA: TetR-like C-terminal domain-containing protein [Acidimicrobiales bacterium]|nr:TetR-like C-terminal domain-containing protein [Acidimicrobiales bacterium]
MLVPEAELILAEVNRRMPGDRRLTAPAHITFVSLEAGGGYGMPLDVDRSFELLVDIFVSGVLARP